MDRIRTAVHEIEPAARVILYGSRARGEARPPRLGPPALSDLHPDGRSINLCDGLFRIEPGSGDAQPDGTLRIEIDLRATANRFLPGHRLRLLVSSGSHPRWNRNLGTGEPLATATRMAAADQAVYHDRLHPSALILPLTGGELPT